MVLGLKSCWTPLLTSTSIWTGHQLARAVGSDEVLPLCLSTCLFVISLSIYNVQKHTHSHTHTHTHSHTHTHTHSLTLTLTHTHTHTSEVLQ